MKLAFLTGLLVACAAAAALLPAEGLAKRGGASAAAGPDAFLVLEGGNGYTILVASIDDWVLLEARRKRVAALYVVRGRVTPTALGARFGDLGAIAARFDPLGARKRGSDPCGRSPIEVGLYRGRIEFHGEDGYTDLSERRAVGLLFHPKPRRCRRAAARSSALRGPLLDTHLTAIGRQRGAVTSLALSRRRGRDWLSLQADREEQRGRMTIFREASTVVGGENAFASSGPGVRPPFAFVAAPKPFTGSAVFDAGAPAGSQWTGTLTAWMPGAGKVPLSGPGFALGFCRRGAAERPCSSEPLVRRPFLDQGSGSQSQLFGEARLSWSRYLRNSASSLGSTP